MKACERAYTFAFSSVQVCATNCTDSWHVSVTASASRSKQHSIHVLQIPARLWSLVPKVCCLLLFAFAAAFEIALQAFKKVTPRKTYFKRTSAR